MDWQKDYVEYQSFQHQEEEKERGKEISVLTCVESAGRSQRRRRRNPSNGRRRICTGVGGLVLSNPPCCALKSPSHLWKESALQDKPTQPLLERSVTTQGQIH